MSALRRVSAFVETRNGPANPRAFLEQAERVDDSQRAFANATAGPFQCRGQRTRAPRKGRVKGMFLRSILL